MAKGVFISFEGGDGAGKSTQLSILASWLRDTGRIVVTTREPGGTELGQAIRALLLHGGEVAPRAEALLYAADRAQHVAGVVRPALAQGSVVLTDRYLDSSLAYQGEGRELGQSDVRQLSEWATGHLYPDVTVLLNVPAGLGLQRGTVDGADRMEAAGQEFHQSVHERFLALAAAEPKRFVVINGLGSIAEVAVRVARAVAGALGVKPDVAEELARVVVEDEARLTEAHRVLEELAGQTDDDRRTGSHAQRVQGTEEHSR
ncbi:dTMP kinase [Neoactinobaculum massilliense]|uniref:dTMP kinase n=1 Tax=Neoactinobaculum massilliense TaxID=2364794 RepID=UPI000F51C988|nr:dTMP kinase [Neoactinobaculum massilliense]